MAKVKREMKKAETKTAPDMVVAEKIKAQLTRVHRRNR